jgi:ATP-dependent Clp protease ATP-binding subunit ClpA
MARIPAKHVSASDKDVLRNLERNLKMVVFGQDEAIDVLTAAIKMSRSGLGDPSKPIGCFLFAGPTGVGKTEVTRQLAMILGIELIRFDMSEYMEAHTVSRLVGAPPGYVGFDQGGLLTEAVTKHPHAVLLLDEIEKAHPDVFNLLLQVMDRGTLTDTNGREANFRNVVLVMTTNAGAAQASRRSMGFVEQDHSTDAMEVIREKGVHAGIPQPSGRDHPVRGAGPRGRSSRGRQVPHRAGIAARRQARALHVDESARTGWLTRVSTR